MQMFDAICMLYMCVTVVLLDALGFNHYPFREICDFFIIFLPDELGAFVYLAGLE